MSSALLVPVVTYFLCGQQLAEAATRAHAERVEAERWAKKLGVDPEMLLDVEAWNRHEKERNEKKRQAALLKMREYTHADEQEAKAKAHRDAVAALRSTHKQRLRDALSEIRLHGLSDAKAKTKLATVSPKLASALTHPPKTTAKADGKPLIQPAKVKRPVAHPPSPRLSGKLGALSPDTEALYASVWREGASVLLADNREVPVESVLTGSPDSWVPSFRAQPAAYFPATPWALPLVEGALPPPTADDLAQTPETMQSPEVLALASQLGHSAVALYNYVHTQVQPELYYGSKKGAQGALLEKSGNDFDQASLLISLLRASGIPSRYEYGTVALSLRQAQALTGAPDVAHAVSIMNAAGIPATATADGSGVQMERAWVRAFVPYEDYRGTGTSSGGSIWVRLDPEMKRVTHRQTVNLKGLVTFDFNGYLSTQNPKTPKEVFEAQLLSAAKAGNVCNSLDDAIDTPVIAQDNFQLLPAEHPATVLSSLLVFARPPQTFRHVVTVTLDTDSFTFELPQLQYHTLALRFVGSSAADQAAIAAAGGISHVVPYQVLVAPSLSAHFGHRDQPDRFIVITRIGHRDRSAATLV